MSRMPIMEVQCATCPFRAGVEKKFRDVRRPTMEMVLKNGSRICHCTGKNGFHADTGQPEKLCRGARNFQLNVLSAIGFLEAATDNSGDRAIGKGAGAIGGGPQPQPNDGGTYRQPSDNLRNAKTPRKPNREHPKGGNRQPLQEHHSARKTVAGFGASGQGHKTTRKGIRLWQSKQNGRAPRAVAT